MTVLSHNAFSVNQAKLVQILSPGTTGRPSTPGVDLKVTVVPQEAKNEGVDLTRDKYVVVAHLPKENGDWERWTMRPMPPEQVGYRGSVTINEFIAGNIPVNAALAVNMGIWFSVEKAPAVHVQQTPTSLRIDETPGDTLAWGQGFGDNVHPRYR